MCLSMVKLRKPPSRPSRRWHRGPKETKWWSDFWKLLEIWTWRFSQEKTITYYNTSQHSMQVAFWSFSKKNTYSRSDRGSFADLTWLLANNRQQTYILVQATKTEGFGSPFWSFAVFEPRFLNRGFFRSGGTMEPVEGQHQQLAPMWVVHMQDLLKMQVLQKHQERKWGSRLWADLFLKSFSIGVLSLLALVISRCFMSKVLRRKWLLHVLCCHISFRIWMSQDGASCFSGCSSFHSSMINQRMHLNIA